MSKPIRYYTRNKHRFYDVLARIRAGEPLRKIREDYERNNL